MYFEANKEDKARRQELSIAELELRLEALAREEEALLAGVDLSHDQLTGFLDNKANVPDHHWEEVRKQRTTFNERLERDLKSIRNPLKVKKSYSSLHVQRHWLQVK